MDALNVDIRVLLSNQRFGFGVNGAREMQRVVCFVVVLNTDERVARGS